MKAWQSDREEKLELELRLVDKHIKETYKSVTYSNIVIHYVKLCSETYSKNVVCPLDATKLFIALSLWLKHTVYR